MIEWLTAGVFYQVGKDVWARIRGRSRRLTPSQIIELRSKWKPLFERRIADTYERKTATRCDYPRHEAARQISEP